MEESAGHLSGHQHCQGRGGHHFPSKTSAHPSMHQLPDQEQPSRPPAGRGRLAVEGGLRAGHQRDFPQVLQPAVPGSEKDIRDAYLHVPMHKAVRKYLRFVVNKQIYQFIGLPFGLATSPRELYSRL